jgi:hypothetical protein
MQSYGPNSIRARRNIESLLVLSYLSKNRKHTVRISAINYIAGKGQMYEKSAKDHLIVAGSPLP